MDHVDHAEQADNAKTSQIPQPLLQELVRGLTEANAAVASHNDPSVLKSFIRPPSTLTLVLISLGLFAVAFIAAQISNYREIRANWSHYRCDPSIAPFAQFYGYNLSENLNFCIAEGVREHAGGVINPIYAGIDKITGVVDGVYNQVESIAGGVGSLLKGLREFVANFINSMRLIGTRVRMSFIHMKDIFARVYGLFIAFAYAGISAITFGENLICNPLVVFLGTITGVDICCFAPETAVIMADGSTKPIPHVRIGDCLAGGSVVESTYMFSGADTKMCRLSGVHVSANHYVVVGDKTIPVGEHPLTAEAEELPRLWCLGTSNHRIPVLSDGRRIDFVDYEESSDPAVIAETQRIAEMELNQSLNEIKYGSTVPDYGLGLDYAFQVHMANGAWTPIAAVHIDDELMGGGVVKGVIRELCETQVKTPGGHWISAAQLILHEGRWQRAANIWPLNVKERETILCHLMATSNAAITVKAEDEVFLVRDYAEVASAAVQAPYDRSLTK